MIGNDIIDLSLSRTESNWQRKGWIQKIFTADEQVLISSTIKKEQMVWLLWSMKEAAYKIINRQTRQTFYAPAKFNCCLNQFNNNTVRGIVRFENEILYTSTSTSLEFIHTIATLQNNCTGITVYIRSESDKELQPYTGYYFFKDEYGIPYLQDSSGSIIPVSKSHHGRFEAIAF